MQCDSSDYSTSLTLRFTNFQQDDWKHYECVVQDKRNQSVLMLPLDIVVIRKLIVCDYCAFYLFFYVYVLLLIC